MICEKGVAIVICGYSLSQEGALHPLLVARLNKGYSLYKPGMPIIVSGKMPPAAVAPQRCEIKTEAAAMRDFLLEEGVNEQDVFLEELSCTTFTNAFYSRVLHLDLLGVKTAYVVSNLFHMPLVQYCFEIVFGEAIKPIFIAAENEGLTVDEDAFREKNIQKMTTEIYPALCKGIAAGDLSAIHRIVNEASIRQPSPTRIKFEMQLREMLGLSDQISLRGLI